MSSKKFISKIDVHIDYTYTLYVYIVHLKMNSIILFNIICVYRPPNCNTTYHENICKLFDIGNLTQQNSNSSIIIEDFNLPHFNWKEYTFPSYSKMYALFYNSNIKNSFLQLLNKPTRNNNIVDLLFINEKND